MWYEQYNINILKLYEQQYSQYKILLLPIGMRTEEAAEQETNTFANTVKITLGSLAESPAILT